MPALPDGRVPKGLKQTSPELSLRSPGFQIKTFVKKLKTSVNDWKT